MKSKLMWMKSQMFWDENVCKHIHVVGDSNHSMAALPASAPQILSARDASTFSGYGAPNLGRPLRYVHEKILMRWVAVQLFDETDAMCRSKKYREISRYNNTLSKFSIFFFSFFSFSERDGQIARKFREISFQSWILVIKLYF